MVKNKYWSILIITIFFCLYFANSASAALELKYPNIPGYVTPSPNCTGNDCLSIFVAYWFGVLIYLAGFISVISFTVGAIGLISPNIESHSEAKNRMKGAILGLGLTLASFIIARTINESLITPGLTPIDGAQGVFYYNSSSKERKPVAVSGDISTDLVARGFDQFIYDCSDSGLAPALLIWEFPDISTNFQYVPNIRTVRKNCGETEDISDVVSYKIAYEEPGVYYCIGGCQNNMCSNYMSEEKTTSEDRIESPFLGQIDAIRIVNDASKGTYYGAILHKSVDHTDGGSCLLPIINTSSEIKCTSVKGSEINSTDIFAWNSANPPTTSGDGVEFYSESYGWDSGAKALRATVSNANIGSSIYYKSGCDLNFFKLNPNIDKEYNEKIDQPDEYKFKCEEGKCRENISDNNGNAANSNEDTNNNESCSKDACETFQDCHKSLRIKGSYLVGLYSKSGDDKSYYCQTFTKNVEDLESTPFIKSGSAEIERVYVIPLND